MAEKIIESVKLNPYDFCVTTDNLEFPYVESLTTNLAFAMVDMGARERKRGLMNIPNMDNKAVSHLESMLKSFQDTAKAIKMVVHLPVFYEDGGRRSPVYEEFIAYLNKNGLNISPRHIEASYICEHCDVITGGNNVNSKTVILEDDYLNVIFYNSLGKWINQRKPVKIRFAH